MHSQDNTGTLKPGSLQLIREHIIASNDAADKDSVANLLLAVEKLFALEDQLTLLVLENTLVDMLHSKVIIHISKEQDIHPGKFSLANRFIVISDSEWHKSSRVEKDAAILLHEMAHAVSCFAFRIDPFLMKQSFEEHGYGDLKEVQRAVKQAMTDFIKKPQLPYSSKKKATFNNQTNEYTDGLNPAELKFNQCIREVAAKIKQDGYLHFDDDAGFDVLASSLQECIHDTFNETKPQNLEEVFSRYMECRLYLLNKTQHNSIPSDKTFELLKELSPRLHDYFETDVKKLLLHRLTYFSKKFPGEFESKYFTMYPQQESKGVQEKFIRDGTLGFSKKK
jgi:hypothetical protein